VIAADDSKAPVHDYVNYIPSSRPGHVAPHAWLHDGSSLYDHFGQGFTLLAAPDAPAVELERARVQAQESGVPLTILQRTEGALAQLYPQALTLIRPDQHVAWRGESLPVSGLFELITGRTERAISPGGPMQPAAYSQRRANVIAVHSVNRFVYSVPDLKVAREFYTAFGLNVRDAAGRLDLYTHGHAHCWASLFQAPGPKRLQYVCYGIFAEDEAAFVERIRKAGLAAAPHALAVDAGGLWLKDPDGVATQLLIAPKVSPSAAFEPAKPAAVAAGQGAATARAKTKPVRPRHLSHILRYCPDVPRMTQFNRDVLGLRLSDKSLDIIAFLHTPHGSDHHLVAYAKSHAPGLHHSSWDVASVDEVGAGTEQMRSAGFGKGWGLGRHVLGSNYFNYVEDPWGSYCEYSHGIDFIPPTLDWPAADHAPVPMPKPAERAA